MLLAACICVWISCRLPGKPKDQIKSIEIATDGCLAGCPVIAIRIDSSLTLKYHGGFNAVPKGFYSGVVTQGFWDTLNVKLKQINFKKLDTAQYYSIDGEVAEAIFYWDSHKRHIFKSIYENPDSVSSVLIWIINSYKHIDPHKLKDSVKFETTYQNMQPPILIEDHVLFPPPKKRRK